MGESQGQRKHSRTSLELYASVRNSRTLFYLHNSTTVCSFTCSVLASHPLTSTIYLSHSKVESAPIYVPIIYPQTFVYLFVLQTVNLISLMVTSYVAPKPSYNVLPESSAVLLENRWAIIALLWEHGSLSYFSLPNFVWPKSNYDRKPRNKIDVESFNYRHCMTD